MKHILIIAMLIGAIALTGCSEIGFLQIQNEPEDAWMPLPTEDLSADVTCSMNSECQTVIQSYGEFDTATECREGICYFESKPSFKQVSDGGVSSE